MLIPPILGAGQDGRSGRTCPPAMSTTFAAGTTDGPSNVDEFGQKLWMNLEFYVFFHRAWEFPWLGVERFGTLALYRND